jgi:hypothetical protein
MFEISSVTEGLIKSVFSTTSNNFQKLLSTPAESHRQVPSKKGIKKFSAKYWPHFHGALKHRSFPMEKSNGQSMLLVCQFLFLGLEG